MGDFSVAPTQSLATNLAKGYIGLHIEQGVPLRDEDLNLLGDLVLAAARIIAAGYIGSGVAAGRDGFEVVGEGADNDLTVRAGVAGGTGTCLVEGIEVHIDGPLQYSDQADVAAPTTPTPAQPDPRIDTVYLDVWLADVDSDVDPDLANPGDVGLQTSTRVRPQWRVRVAEGADVADPGLPLPVPDTGHAHYPLARLTRPRNVAAIDAAMVTDLRQRNLTVADLENRVQAVEEAVLRPALLDAPGQTRPFTPPLGAPGSVVQIFGRNLRVGATVVLFGGTPAASVDAHSDSQIGAVVPSMPAGAVTITVQTDGGSVTSEDTFTVLPEVAGSPPVLAAPPGEFNPPLGAPGTAVQVAGSNFDGPNLAVAFAGTPATITASDATSISVTVPAMTSGPAAISVTTDFGSDTTVNNFTVL